MSTSYDLLITVDPSTGTNPGIQDRAYHPGTSIKGFVDLSVYETITIDSIQVALLGFLETTYTEGTGRNPRVWKEKHIFLKQQQTLLPPKTTRVPYLYKPSDTEHSIYEFLIPEYSLCETCGRTERLPPSMEEARASDGNRVLGTASITYQVEVAIELRARGNIFFHEKFVLQPLANAAASQVYNDIKRNFVFGEHVFKAKPASSQSLSLIRLVFKSSSLGRSYNIPLRIGVRPEVSHATIVCGGNTTLPPITFLFEYPCDSLVNPPMVNKNQKGSTKLGQFVIRSLSVRHRFRHIRTLCAGREGAVQSKSNIYINNTLNVPFDIATTFSYNKATNTYQHEMRLFEDIIGHMIDVPLDSYEAEFPLHCNHIARINGTLDFEVGIAPASEAEAAKTEKVLVTIPFRFLGVEDNLVAPQAPPGHSQGQFVPVDAKSQYHPPPADSKVEYAPPAGPPSAHDTKLLHQDFVPPSGPPPSQTQLDFAPPSGPPPSVETSAFDVVPPSGPPPTSTETEVAPPSYQRL